MYITIYSISAQTSGVNQTVEPLKLTHRTPGVPSNPGYEPLLYCWQQRHTSRL